MDVLWCAWATFPLASVMYPLPMCDVNRLNCHKASMRIEYAHNQFESRDVY
jgi:hypothetical protein